MEGPARSGKAGEEGEARFMGKREETRTWQRARVRGDKPCIAHRKSAGGEVKDGTSHGAGGGGGAKTWVWMAAVGTREKAGILVARAT